MKQILLLFLLLPLAAFSQRIQSDQTDDFGKLRRIATSRVEFSNFTTSLGGTVTINESDTMLCMNLFFRWGSKPLLMKTRALLKLDNGETIQVFNRGRYKELTATEPGFIVFALNEKEKAKLQVHHVIEYSIHTNNATVKVELNEPQQNAFYKTIYILESQARSEAASE